MKSGEKCRKFVNGLHEMRGGFQSDNLRKLTIIELFAFINHQVNTC